MTGGGHHICIAHIIMITVIILMVLTMDGDGDAIVRIITGMLITGDITTAIIQDTLQDIITIIMIIITPISMDTGIMLVPQMGLPTTGGAVIDPTIMGTTTIIIIRVLFLVL
jgi:hypothetical protein